jgi:hypothetical protein
MNTKERVRFADSVVIEPLINDWVAYSYLVSPQTTGLQVDRYQIPILESYLESPEIHCKAASDPELMAGPYVNVPAAEAGKVRDLLDRTLKNQSEILEFARELLHFQKVLAEKHDGLSLEPVYSDLPNRLKGYVELVYDYRHVVNTRILEPLLYKSRYYRPDLQSMRLFRLGNDFERPFFLNTPRLGGCSEVRINMAFQDPRLEELFRLDSQPRPLGEIVDLLGDVKAADQLQQGFVTSQPANLRPRYTGDRVRLQYLGHACVLLEYRGISIIVDPVVPAIPESAGSPRISYKDLPGKIDFALVTHNHQDHLSLETLLRLRHRIGCLIVPKCHGILYGDISLKTMAYALGFSNVIELDTLESAKFEGGSITAIPFFGEHGDLAHGKAGFVVSAAGNNILFSADSDCLDPSMYENVADALGPIEHIFLGTESVGATLSWICGPLFPVKPTSAQEQSRRYHGCNADRALALLEAVKCRTLYNYAMGLEPWMTYILGLALSNDSQQMQDSECLLRRAGGRGIQAVRLFGPQTIYLDPHNISGARHSQETIMEEQVAKPSIVNHESSPEVVIPIKSKERIATGTRAIGPFVPAAFVQSLREIAGRDPILWRAASGGDPVGYEPEKNYSDISTLSKDEQQATIHTIALKSKDVSTDASVGVDVLKIGPNEHYVQLSAPVHLTDARHCIALCYKALRSNSKAELAELRVLPEFSTDGEWDNAVREQAAFWSNQFAGGFAIQSLTGVSAGGGPFSRTITISQEQLQSLKSHYPSVDLSLILLAALQSLLSELLDQSDIAVSTCSQELALNPEDPALPIGRFTVIRIDLSGNPAFDKVLMRLHAVVQRAHQYLTVPLEVLNEYCPSGFQFKMGAFPEVFFEYRDTNTGFCEAGGLKFFTETVDAPLPRPRLAIMAEMKDGEIHCAFSTNGAIDEDLLTGLTENYLSIIRLLSENSSWRLDALLESAVNSSFVRAKSTEAEEFVF